MNSVFGRTVGYVLQPRNFIKTMVHHRLFYQSIPRTKNYFSYSKNKILVILMPMPTLMPMMMPRSRCGDFQMTKVYLLFKKFYARITQDSLGLRVRNFQGIVFIWMQTYREMLRVSFLYEHKHIGHFQGIGFTWIQTYREIFKSGLVYL